MAALATSPTGGIITKIMSSYIVRGGIYTNVDFVDLIPDTAEEYGPIEDYDDAYKVWSAHARSNIDICCHRLFIEPSQTS